MDASPAKSPENMTSTELQAHLASRTTGTPSKPAKASKAKPAAKSNSKPAKASKAKPAAKSKSKPAKRQPRKLNQSKAQKAKAAAKSKVPVVRTIAAFMVANKGKAFRSTDLATRFKSRPVEIHRAVALLERQGAVVEASRSGPTQKPGRRAFLYTVTKAPAVKAAKSKS